MRKNAGTENELAELHKYQTELYLKIVQSILSALDSDDVQTRVIAASAVSPALLNSINTFLKNNDITCQPSELDELTSTEKRLRAKLKRAGKPLPAIEFDDMQEVCQ